MLINDTNIKSFRMTKVFRENTERINACDFNKNGLSNLDSIYLYFFLIGDLLISSSDDDTIVVYDCESGLPKRPIPSKKYGCDMIRFTRSGEQALHCSMKVDGKNKYFAH